MKQTLLYHYKGRFSVKDWTVLDLFQKQVAEHPSNVAVVFEDKTLTYLELDVLFNQLVNYTFAYNSVNGDSSITSIN
ncbi:hypothetical protein [Flavobacterium sp. 7A]|uniref:hypothetical protein n=1 Tax=Flavobacterium sp. 7A TaxID=2940571 RepID=UPI0022278A09|nr:hypothetical protein [Flavobacterium sp. 7A]MCW2121110.1 non-ribosomal peptide synthetase component E (peptide arylation enzyme) [Flavobacterium sp. 7A]